jgi:hypothetical protein
MEPELYGPVLDCFARGLPFLFRDTDAPTGTTILLEITGDSGGRWALFRGATGWTLVANTHGESAARVIIPQSLAWRIFTKGIDREPAREQVEIHGDPALGEKVLQLIAIVA